MKSTDSANYSEALRFLVALDPTTTTFCFQIFDDLKSRRDRRLAAAFSDTLENRFDYLTRMNGQGAGVFVCANSIKAGCARKIEYLERVRAIYQDDDKGFRGSYPIAPSITVQSSMDPIDKFQRYWIADQMEPDLHRGIMRRMVLDYGCDPGAVDLVRVLRLPGFMHMKNPDNPHPVRLIECSGWVYSVDQIAAAFPPIWPSEPEKPKPFDSRSFDQREFVRLIEAMSYIPSNDRLTWLRVGMALRREYGESAQDLWDGWSKTSSKFNAKDQAKA